MRIGRRLGLGLLVLFAVVALAACGDSEDSDSDSSATARADSGASSPTTSDGNDSFDPNAEIVIALGNDTANLDGDNATVGMGSPPANIYDTLVFMGNDFQVRPGLATEWELLEDGETWRFHLREGVLFHDGTELTAADVVWTMDRIARAGGRAIRAQEGGTVAVDDYTVDFTPSSPNAKTPLQIVHPVFGIMKADSDPVAAPVGTGPFRFVEYQPGEFFRVARFDDYWDEEQIAGVAAIEFRFIPDNNSRILALQADDVDIAGELGPDAIDALLAGDGLTVETSLVGAYQAISMNIRGEDEWALTADLDLRRAIAMAIDRESIVEAVYQGYADVGRNLIPPAILGDASEAVEGGPAYDPDGARAILDQAGWVAGDDGIRERDGQRLTLRLVNGYPEPEVHRPIPEVLQLQLAEVGIEVEIYETLEYETFLTDAQGHLWLERGNQNDANAAFLPALLYRLPENGGFVADYAIPFGPGGEYDELLNEALESTDVAATQELTAEAMHIQIDEEVIIVPIAGLVNIWGARAGIEGFDPHSARVHTRFSSVRVAE